MIKHWSVSYYFTDGRTKREYKGVVCDCFHGTRADAITSANITQDEMSGDNVLVRVIAVPQTNKGLCDLATITASKTQPKMH
jgi:hypothetical protein